MINGLDLFSGIGGITLALAPWVRPIAYCENERYAQAILLSNMERGILPIAPIWSDVRTLTGSDLLAGEFSAIDIIYGGFPCQDISTAGAGAGLEGKRSGLFFEIVRLARTLRPQFIFLENVPAITVRGLDRVLMEFSALGYDCRWTIVSAAEVGAPHLRERWFLLASHPNGKRFRNKWKWNQEGKTETDSIPWNYGEKESLADTAGERCGEEREFRRQFCSEWPSSSGEALANSNGDRRKRSRDQKARAANPIANPGWWTTEPDVGRVANGIPARVDRLRGLGNAVVPQQTREAFERLMGLK